MANALVFVNIVTSHFLAGPYGLLLAFVLRLTIGLQDPYKTCRILDGILALILLLDLSFCGWALHAYYHPWFFFELVGFNFSLKPIYLIKNKGHKHEEKTNNKREEIEYISDKEYKYF